MFGGLFQSKAPSAPRAGGKGSKGKGGKGKHDGSDRNGKGGKKGGGKGYKGGSDSEEEGPRRKMTKLERRAQEEEEEKRNRKMSKGARKRAERRAEKKTAAAEEAAAAAKSGDKEKGGSKGKDKAVAADDLGEQKRLSAGARKRAKIRAAKEAAAARGEVTDKKGKVREKSSDAADLSEARLSGKKKNKKKRERSDSTAAVEKLTSTAASNVVEQPKKKKARKGDTTESTVSKGTGSAVVANVPESMLSAAGGDAATRLKGSRFRWLNEMLYTTPGDEAKAEFDKDPSLMFAYHEGFRAQAAKWPRNPLDDVIAWIRKEVPKGSTVGDFGCGEARLALELQGHCTVHSFDLIAMNDRITPCNLANVPIADGTLDAAVFCLALMGTDWLIFVEEARRCLKPNGLCHIVEVESRFDDVNAVVRSVESVGFRKVLLKPSSFFIDFRFARTEGKPQVAKGKKGKKGEVEGSGMRACIYRRR